MPQAQLRPWVKKSQPSAIALAGMVVLRGLLCCHGINYRSTSGADDLIDRAEDFLRRLRQPRRHTNRTLVKGVSFSLAGCSARHGSTKNLVSFKNPFIFANFAPDFFVESIASSDVLDLISLRTVSARLPGAFAGHTNNCSPHWKQRDGRRCFKELDETLEHREHL